MIRLGVLCRPEGWHFRDLCRAAAERSDGPLELVPLNWSALAGSLNADRSSVQWGADPPGTAIRTLDGVLVRAMPAGTLQQVVLRMDLLAEWERAGMRIINSPRSIECAVDKYLTLCRLHAAGIPIPSTSVFQDEESAAAMADQLGPVVLKPLFGSEGKGLTKLESGAQLRQHLQALTTAPVESQRIGGVFYLQEFLPHDQDFRILVVGDSVYGMRRVNRHHWVTNVSRGGTGVPWTPTEEAADLARRAAHAVGAVLAGVDLIEGEDGTWRVLEVNSSPGWRALGAVQSVDVAGEILEFLLRQWVSGTSERALATPAGPPIDC